MIRLIILIFLILFIISYLLAKTSREDDYQFLGGAICVFSFCMILLSILFTQIEIDELRKEFKQNKTCTQQQVENNGQ